MDTQADRKLLPWAQNDQESGVSQDGNSVSNKVEFAQLPAQAQHTYRLILRGGPFAYKQDGSVFGNYDGRLPVKSRGYYQEYTVKTPGVNHRGARRIVCGGQIQDSSHVCYYTQDHYASFRQIIEAPLP